MKYFIKFILLSSYVLLIIIFYGCADSGENYDQGVQANPEKQYLLDRYGNIETTEIAIDDFLPASKCMECHDSHYAEWSRSMHAYSMKNPVFFSVSVFSNLDHRRISDTVSITQFSVFFMELCFTCRSGHRVSRKIETLERSLKKSGKSLEKKTKGHE